jgi:Tfp pilus assembly protein FimT
MAHSNPAVGRARGRQAGYSIAEAILVVALILVASSVAVLNIQSVYQSNQADTAVQIVTQAMRTARQLAISDRRVFRISFTAPRQIEIHRVDPGTGALTKVGESFLPPRIEFRCESGIPTSSSATPDNFGAGAVAIDFNSQTAVFFQPDGAGRDSVGRISNGLVYMARSGALASARAVTLFGSTGRIRSWKLINSGGTWTWQ